MHFYVNDFVTVFGIYTNCFFFLYHTGGFPGNTVVKYLPATAGDARNTGSVPGLRRSSRGGHGNPLQYSCLENLMDRGAWRVTDIRVAKSWT